MFLCGVGRLPVVRWGESGRGKNVCECQALGTVPDSATSPSLSQLGTLAGFNPSKPAVVVRRQVLNFSFFTDKKNFKKSSHTFF